MKLRFFSRYFQVLTRNRISKESKSDNQISAFNSFLGLLRNFKTVYYFYLAGWLLFSIILNCLENQYIINLNADSFKILSLNPKKYTNKMTFFLSLRYINKISAKSIKKLKKYHKILHDILKQRFLLVVERYSK